MSTNVLSMLQQRFACARLSHSYLTHLLRLLTMTLTTVAFDQSSSWQFEASSYMAAPKGPPSSLVQLRIAAWTGGTRDEVDGASQGIEVT